MAADQHHLKSKVLIMNGFSNQEISLIMKTLKEQFEKPEELIFATTTAHSLEMKVREVIEDLSGEHEYFKNKNKG